MKRAFVKLLLGLLFVNGLSVKTAECQTYPYKFNYLTVDEGLSHTDANDIAQDKKGFIWVGTFFGLDRFDGYSVKKFYNKNVPVKNAFKNRITCLASDQDGNIWLGTEDGLQCFNARSEKYTDFEDDKGKSISFQKIYKPSGDLIYILSDRRLKAYKIEGNKLKEKALNTPDLSFSDMTTDKTGTLLFSSNKGLWMMNEQGNWRALSVKGLTNFNLSTVYADKNNDLLVTAGNSVSLITRINEAGKQSLVIKKQFVSDRNILFSSVASDSKSDYWVNTGSELIRLDKNLHFIQKVDNKASTRGLNSNSLVKVLIDRTDCLWVCTFGGGLNYCDLNVKLFYTLQHDPAITNSLSGNHIRSVLADEAKVYIGTTANGLNIYNLKTQKFEFLNSYNSRLKLKNDVVTALMFDNNKNLWISTAAGIQVLRAGGNELWNPKGSENFPTHTIDTFAKDIFGNIWFGNHTDQMGVIWKDEKNYYHVKYYGVGFFIYADQNFPQLFISSTRGLKRIIIDKQGKILKSFNYSASSTANSLSSNYTYPIGKQNDSTYWIGTIGGGLNRLFLNTADNRYSIKHNSDDYGVFKDVESLEVDDEANVWMGGNGLEFLNTHTGKLIRYDKNDGLQGNSFKVASSFKGPDGRMYFGGINGLNYFFPHQIKLNTIDARPVLTNIRINNEQPAFGENTSSENVISQAIGYCKSLRLNYLQNNFVISFSSMHFANPSKCKYRYQLKGYDEGWKYTDGDNPTAAYSNLNYDTFKFIVQATNNDGIWSKVSSVTEVSIIPPWWKSLTAKIIYMLMFISGILGVYIYQARWYRLKREIEVNSISERKREEMHKQKEELYQQQLMFFTNVSHEFRTPLTLILGPLESLMIENKNPALDYSYQLIFKNAKRLMNLITELMNFKKVADSIIRLQVQPLVINQFFKDIAWEFQNLAINKGISFEINDHTENQLALTGEFDVQILEKILFNLLNNSLKYTNTGGSVSFDLFLTLDEIHPSFEIGFKLLNQEYRAKRYIYFKVADTGIGISAESITRIFDRYYRVSKSHLGSGVGLALVKSLTQLHKGDIYVYSERYKGTEIIIGIPWGDENYSTSERATSRTEVHAQLEVLDGTTMLPMEIPIKSESSVDIITGKHILLVEDNEELRTFLRKALEKSYLILEAEDGNKGLELAVKKVPDLIISDVMMPGLNGIELCKQLKSTFETSHIPFIILSAKDALDVKIEGIESGADYYFAKPLSLDILLLTVHNIFEKSEKLKLRFTKNYLSEASELVHTEKDKQFINKLLNLVEENIDHTDLDVDFLCKHLYISRTKLYQKIKSISDQSVAEFIRTLRLKKAIHIMTHEDITMNQVVDRIGMQSSSNFSRAFKKEYGKSPLQFMQSLKQTSQYNKQL
jgi:signal transduction histidine kinase/DNA-binding response OmpR family regulator/ligand-binding sensor domain-containing protein